MPQRRFFLDAPFTCEEEVELTNEEAHHLTRVMRIQEGELVELVNGRSQLAESIVLSTDKRSASLKITSIHNEPPPSFSIILCQAIPKLNRLDTILEKGTELGMTEIWLFPGVLSEKTTLSSTQLQRAHAIIISAMKQCGRLDLPSIHIKAPLSDWPQKDFKSMAYYGDLSSTAPLFAPQIQGKNSILFFNGPESGFSREEKKFLCSQGVQGVYLHPNILRTDTASLVALSIIQYQKDWNCKKNT